MMMPPTDSVRPAKHSVRNVALTVRSQGRRQQRPAFRRTGEEQRQTNLPRECQCAGQDNGCQRKKPEHILALVEQIAIQYPRE